MVGKSSSSAHFNSAATEKFRKEWSACLFKFLFYCIYLALLLEDSAWWVLLFGSPKPNFTLNSLSNFWSFLLQVCFHAFTILKRKVLYLESEDLHRKHT